MHATAERKKLHLLTVAEYMTLETPARTELLGGVIFEVSPKNVPHSRAVAALAKALTRGLPDSYSVLIQDPVAVSGWTGRDAPEIDRKAAAAGTGATRFRCTFARASPRGSSTCARAASSAIARRPTSRSRTGTWSAKARRSTCSASRSR